MNDYKFKISPHKSGLLRGTVTINGRQIHQYGHTEREVREKLKLIREEAIRGNIIPAKQRLEDAMHSYLFGVKIKTVKGSFFDRVECTFNNPDILLQLKQDVFFLRVIFRNSTTTS